MTAPPQQVKKQDVGRHPGPIEIPDCMQCVLQFDLSATKTASIVFHAIIQTSFTFSVTNADTIFAQIIAAFNSAAGMNTLVPTTAGLHGFSIRDVRPQAMAPLIPSATPGVPGTSVEPALPGGVALVMSLITAHTGPANRGRMYIPAWAQNADIGGGVASQPAIDAAGNLVTGIQAGLSATGCQLAIGKPQRLEYIGITGRLHPARDASTERVTTFKVRDNRWDYQRRRTNP